MAKKTEAKRPSTDPCAADHVLIGAGGRLTLRVRFDPFGLFLAVPAADGSTSDVVVTEQTVRYEFNAAEAKLSLVIEPPPDRRVEARQRVGTQGWGPLEPIVMPNNDRCVPTEYKFWDAAEPEPATNSLPQLQIKARKHAPKIGGSKSRPKDE